VWKRTKRSVGDDVTAEESWQVEKFAERSTTQNSPLWSGEGHVFERRVRSVGRAGAYMIARHVVLVLLLAASTAFVFNSQAGAATPQWLYSWGDFGEDGHASPSVDSPTLVHGVPGTIQQIVATNAATYLLLTDGQVWTFGANDYGELGQGSTGPYTKTPVQVPLPPIASLPTSMPYATAFAIDTTGHIWGWGSNKGGELCLGNTAMKTSPVELPLSAVTTATGAGEHASYVANGTLESCGLSDYGQLGNGSFSRSTTPVDVQLTGVVGLYSSFADTGALLSNGTYWDWGNNAYGQLGDGNITNSAVPVEVATNVAAAAVGGNNWQDGQTFVTLSNGATEAWGADAYGQLCTGHTASSVPNPVVVNSPAGVNWTTWDSGGSTSYPVDSNRNLWVCGFNRGGEAGLGTKGGNIVTPTKVMSNVEAVSSTSRNVAALVEQFHQ
jgi:alpha-tubulin suppressor-like RCC1 family protein